MRATIDLHHKQAADTGARIVHACGFDSIPSDLSVFSFYRRASRTARENCATPLWCYAVSGRPLGRHRRVDDGSDGGVQRSRAPRAQRPLLAVRRPGRGTGTGRSARRAVAARRRDRPRTARVVDGGVPDGGVEHPSCAAQQRPTGLGVRSAARYGEQMSVGTSIVAPVAAAVLTGALNAMLGLAADSSACPRVWSSACCPSRVPAPASRHGKTATTGSRRTPRRRGVYAMALRSRSGATPVTRPPRCCWGRAGSRWRWTATTCRSSQGADPCGGDGGCAAGETAGRRGVAGGGAPEVNAVSKSPERSSVRTSVAEGYPRPTTKVETRCPVLTI